MEGPLLSEAGKPGGMSKPFAASKSSGLPFSVTLTCTVAFPPFGGFCMYSALVPAFIV